MALQKQLVPLPIDKGLETKLDPKQEEIGYLRQAVNVVYETIKLLRKRNGYSITSGGIISGGNLSGTRALTKYKRELVAFAENKLYSFSQARMKWAEKGTLYPASTASKDVYVSATSQTQVTGICVEGFYIYTWIDGTTIKYSVQDASDDSFIVSNGTVGTGTRVRVSNISNYVYIIYVDGSALKFRKFSVLEPQSLGTAITITSTVNATDKLIDTDTCGMRIYVAYNSNSVGSELALFYIEQDDTTSSILNVAGQKPSEALNITCDEASRLIISYSDGLSLKYTVYPFVFTTPLLAPTAVDSTDNIVNCTVALTAIDGQYKIYYEVDATTPQNNFVKSASISGSGSVTSVAVFKRSVGLAACALYTGETTLVSTVHDSEVQGTYFIFDQDGVLVAKHQNQKASGVNEFGVLPPVTSLGDSQYFIPNEIKNRIEADNTLQATTSSAARTILDLDPDNKYQSAELADSLHICAGALKMYDGNVVVEHGFHVYPEILTQINPVPITVATTAEGTTGVKDIQLLTYSAVPTAGTFTLTFESQTTAAINFSDSNATIKSKIEALAAIVTVTVTGSFAAGHTIQFDDPVQNISLAIVGSNTLVDGVTPVTVTPTTLQEGILAVKEVQTLTFGSVPVAGQFKLDISGETTTAINHTQGATELKAALDALPSIGSTTVTGSFSAGFTITFDTPVAPIAQATVFENSLQASLVSGNMSDGNYGYVAVYRWTDNTGKDHRSSPTLVVLNVELSGTGNTQAITIRVPTLRLTEKVNVVLELYRTEDDGTTFYKVTDDLDPALNDTAVDYIDITDTLSDADLIRRELLYTTGGVLQNIPAPACTLITVFNNRLSVVEEDSNRVWFSKLNSAGFPVEFTDLIYRDTDPVGGEITSILAMNEKLAIFEKDSCFFIAGDGPNNLGQQDTFTQPEIVSTDIGSLRQNSVVLTPPGIMFQSRKGVWLLTPSLQLSYVGSNVEQYNDSIITSAKVIGELNQIRFTTDTQIALVYNYNLNRWATFDNHGALSAVVIENDYYYLREDGAIYKENRETFSDASSSIKMTIETGWMSFAELQGFQRIYHAMILGTFKSRHKLRVKVAYDFVDAWSQEVLIDTEDFIDPAAYGDDSPYGEGSPYGGSGNLYEARVDFARQKCTAVKILIEDAQSQVGEGFSLSSITLRAGAKSGSNKLPSTNKYGTSV